MVNFGEKVRKNRKFNQKGRVLEMQRSIGNEKNLIFLKGIEFKREDFVLFKFFKRNVRF